MEVNLSTELKDLTLDHVEIQEKLGEGTFGLVNAVTFKQRDGRVVHSGSREAVGT